MIRPITCLAMLAAAGSGLYLYQAKHQGFVLDGRIARVTGETAKLREHIAVLRAEYALLNDPSRLQQLASAHLPDLAPMAPGQYTTLAQLDQRLPPVGPAASGAPAKPALPPGVKLGTEPFDYPPAPVPVADTPRAESPAMADATQSARPDAPKPHPVIASALAVLSPKPAARVAAVHKARPKVDYAASHVAPRRAPIAVAAVPRPDPLAIPAAAPPIGGSPARVASALGMARTLVAPASASYTYQRYSPSAGETLAR